MKKDETVASKALAGFADMARHAGIRLRQARAWTKRGARAVAGDLAPMSVLNEAREERREKLWLLAASLIRSGDIESLGGMLAAHGRSIDPPLGLSLSMLSDVSLSYLMNVAAAEGSVECGRALREAGYPLDRHDSERCDALANAAWAGRVGFVEWLLEQGVVPSLPGGEEKSAMEAAIAGKKSYLFWRLCEVARPRRSHRVMLAKDAAEQGAAEILGQMMKLPRWLAAMREADADVSSPTLLMRACQGEWDGPWMEAVEVLGPISDPSAMRPALTRLSRGPGSEAASDAAWMAMSNNRSRAADVLNVLEVLEKAGARLDRVYDGGATLLERAAKLGDPNACRSLLEKQRWTPHALKTIAARAAGKAIDEGHEACLAQLLPWVEEKSAHASADRTSLLVRCSGDVNRPGPVEARGRMARELIQAGADPFARREWQGAEATAAEAAAIRAALPVLDAVLESEAARGLDAEELLARVRAEWSKWNIALGEAEETAVVARLSPLIERQRLQDEVEAGAPAGKARRL